MTTHLPARTRSVVDPQRTNINLQQPQYSQGRPVSWHVPFVNGYQQFQPFQPYFDPQQYDMYGNTTVTHGLLTPSSFPIMDDAYMDCPNIPLDHMNNQDMNVLQNTFQFSSVYGNGPESNPFQNTSTMMDVHASDSVGQTMTTWPYMPPDFGQNVHTAPVSPDFLPLPDFGNPFDGNYMGEVADKDELVGLGLYDSPAEVQSTSLLLGGSLPIRRKSLKLEESFEPGPLSDEDAESEHAQQDHSSVVSAESQAEIMMTMPSAHMPTQLQSTDYNVELGSFQPQMMPVMNFAGMPMSADHQTSGWF